ncbi:hypothetical protein ABPG74_006513 [Tetrahymena malaccensis]
MDTNYQEKKKIEIDDIQIGELIASTHGEGTKIYRAYYNQKEYALKAVLRDSIETHLELEHLMNERNALRELSHPGINKMLYILFTFILNINLQFLIRIDTIKDDQYLYFLLEIVYGIPLHKLLQMHNKLNQGYVKLIAVQIIKIIEYMHSQGYIYRDLKASNIIVDQYGKVTLIDLGYTKKIENELTNSFCGTIHMIAPELYDQNLEDKGYSYEVDVYSIGILIFELTTGCAPFGYDESNCKQKTLSGINQEILNQIKDDKNLIDLISNLLEKDPKKRPKINSILNHPYFQSVDFKNIELIVNGKTEQIPQEQLNKFHIFEYQEDINDFGLQKASELTQEEKEANKKLNDIFSNF